MPDNKQDDSYNNELRARDKSIKVEDIIVNINIFGTAKQIDQAEDGAQINTTPPEIPEEEPEEPAP